jgi:hypothetical protein
VRKPYSVERHSRFAMLIKVPSKETAAVVAALSQQVRKLPATLRRSLTWDRGWQSQIHADSLYVNGLLGLFANVYLIKGHFIGDVVFIDVANVLHGLLADVFRCDEFYVPEPLVGI